ncbi:MAG TPA: Ig-like domain-containing protein [Acidimicrobiales bacterium]|nr:Ig-like domain-containing protein [Acidimicrobiales bacterium]
MVVLDGSTLGLSGALTVAGAGTLVLDGGTVDLGAKSTSTIAGVIAVEASARLNAPNGAQVDNYGSLLCVSGTTILAGTVVNEKTGTIAAAGAPVGPCVIGLAAPATLTNDGTIWVGPYQQVMAPYTGSQAVTIANYGSVVNAGTFTVKGGATFVEGPGTTSEEPITLAGGALRLTGTGASAFFVPGGNPTTLSGNIAPYQTLEIDGTIDADATFTNDGTLIGHYDNSTVNLPTGGTFTNRGTIDVTPGSQLFVKGSIVNASTGIMNVGGDIAYGAEFGLNRPGATFDNAGIFEMLFGSELDLGATDQALVNTGTMIIGVDVGSNNWGSLGLTSNILWVPPTTAKFNGVIIPVFGRDVPSGKLPSPPKQITYGFLPNVAKAPIHLTCTAAVGGGFSLKCPYSSSYGWYAQLVQASNTTLDPTTTKLTSTSPGPAPGGLNYPTIGYGRSVTFTAVVTPDVARAPEPTGEVIFYSQNGGTEPTVLGASPLKTYAGVAKASLTVPGLTPGLVGITSPYIVGAYYVGDPKTIGSSSQGQYEYVQPASTSVRLRAVAGQLHEVTLAARVVPSSYGPVPPGGRVMFLADGGTSFLGSALVTTAAGTTTATLSDVAVPAGTGPITARYTGDISYNGATSAPVAVGASHAKG